MTIVTYIPSNRVGDIWDQIEPLVTRSLRGIEDEVTSADILGGLLDRKLMLLAAHDGTDYKGVLILSHKKTPQTSFIEIDLVGGYDMATWMTTAVNVVKVIAKTFGVSKVKALGRTGWHKHAAVTGFKPKRTLFEMEIE